MWPLVTLVLVTVTAVVHGLVQGGMDGLGDAPDRYCLACLCQAATGCDRNMGCQEDGGSMLCGPFYMSQPYWQDANSSAVERFGDYDFPRCATDADCAAETVTLYMTKFGRDCDGDGRVTCRDYALMHYLGYTGCMTPAARRQAESSTFHRAFLQCLSNMDALLVAGMMQQHLPGCQS